MVYQIYQMVSGGCGGGGCGWLAVGGGLGGGDGVCDSWGGGEVR